MQQQWTPGVAQQWAPGAVTYMPQQAPTDVEWNITEEGGPLSQTGWSSWKKLPTGATTDTPAPVTFRNDLHLFVRGTDKSIYDTAARLDKPPPVRCHASDGPALATLMHTEKEAGRCASVRLYRIRPLPAISSTVLTPPGSG